MEYMQRVSVCLSTSHLNNVVHLDLRVRVSNGAAIVGSDVWHGLFGHLLASNAAELEGLLLVANAVQGVPITQVITRLML